MHACVQALLFFVSRDISGNIFWKNLNKLNSCFCFCTSFFHQMFLIQSHHYLIFSDSVPVNSEIFLCYMPFPQLFFFNIRLFGYFFQLLTFNLRDIAFMSRLLSELARNIWSSVQCDELQCGVMRKIKCFQPLSKLVFWSKWTLTTVFHEKIYCSESYWGKTEKIFALKKQNNIVMINQKCHFGLHTFLYSPLYFTSFFLKCTFLIISVWKQYFVQHTKSLISNKMRIKLWRANTWTSEV